MQHPAAFGALVILVAATASTSIVVSTQTATIRVRASRNPSWSVPRTAEGHADLQGVWINNAVTPLERPAALKGKKVLSNDEVAELAKRFARIIGNGEGDVVPPEMLFSLALANDLDTRIKNPNATGDLNQMGELVIDNRTSLITDPPDGKIPPLTSAAQERQIADARNSFFIPFRPGMDPEEQKRQTAAWDARRQRPAGPEALSTGLRCITWGVPRLGGNAGATRYSQILQTAGYVTWLNEVNHELRIIPLDGRPHLPPHIRQWNGDSRGRWEGDTLVVDTTNFAPTSYFMGSTENLHLIERFTRVAADTISYEITLDDPTTWTAPWTAEIRLDHTQERLYESACHEGNHHLISGILGAARADERAATAQDQAR